MAEIFVNERNWPVLEFSGSMPLGVNVGYFLELEHIFQRKRIVGSAPDEERDAAILRASWRIFGFSSSARAM